MWSLCAFQSVLTQAGLCGTHMDQLLGGDGKMNLCGGYARINIGIQYARPHRDSAGAPEKGVLSGAEAWYREVRNAKKLTRSYLLFGRVVFMYRDQYPVLVSGMGASGRVRRGAVRRQRPIAHG